jgi:hypothetical protein
VWVFRVENVVSAANIIIYDRCDTSRVALRGLKATWLGDLDSVKGVGNWVRYSIVLLGVWRNLDMQAGLAFGSDRRWRDLSL